MASPAEEGGSSQPFPKTEFVEDIAEVLAGKTVDSVIAEVNERHRLYKLKEHELMQNKGRLLTKLPELQRALDIVLQLIEQREKDEPMAVDYELAKDVFAKAKVKTVDSVNLWLGANVMVEYPLEEAREILETNLSNCKANLKTNDANLDLLRDYITITQVTISRVYNYEIEQRRKAKEAEGAAS